MFIRIEWASGNHGDVDNIWKGIADALFDNDKRVVVGGFYSTKSSAKIGLVEVRIVIFNKSETGVPGQWARQLMTGKASDELP